MDLKLSLVHMGINLRRLFILQYKFRSKEEPELSTEQRRLEEYCGRRSFLVL